MKVKNARHYVALVNFVEELDPRGALDGMPVFREEGLRFYDKCMDALADYELEQERREGR